MLPWLLLNTKSPKMGQNSIKSSFFARRAKKASAEGQSPPQELEVGPRSGSYLLVRIKVESMETRMCDPDRLRYFEKCINCLTSIRVECNFYIRLLNLIILPGSENQVFKHFD